MFKKLRFTSAHIYYKKINIYIKYNIKYKYKFLIK